MNDYVMSIEPHKGLSFFKLDSNINYIFSEIRSRSEKYELVDIVVSEKVSEPLLINIRKDGLKLRFDQNFQRLELIEIDAKYIQDRQHSIYYKGTLLLPGIIHTSPNISNLRLSYNFINNVFGPSSMPKLIDNNKNLLLRYEGISFLFENPERIDNEEDLCSNHELCLNKICIFTEKFLIDSISKDNLLYKHPTPLIKVEIDKGICINLFNNKNEIYINLNESLQEILYKLKNPNYIYYKTSDDIQDDFIEIENNYHNFDSNDLSYIFNNNQDSDFFLNYYTYGLDIMIDFKTNKVKKFICHTNNPFDLKFGIYNLSNFLIEFNKMYIKKLDKINEANIVQNDRLSTHFQYSKPTSRKISEDSAYNSNTYNSCILNLSQTEQNNSLMYKIEKIENFYIPKSSLKEYCNLGYSDTYSSREITNTNIKDESGAGINSCNLNNYIKKSKKSIEKEVEKSFGSMESNLSGSFNINTSDYIKNIVITPHTNFIDVIQKVPPNSYVVYHRHETKLNIVKKYYAFDGVIFEVTDNHSILTVTLIESCYK